MLREVGGHGDNETFYCLFNILELTNGWSSFHSIMKQNLSERHEKGRR